ncbi:hypothetical protein D9757_011092 [Collybiopsis confluens]|uniref:Uncharacterized protein n=1 Tax=Collybiopsis confluens TaxID=2823264 RepID=A0A8H5LXB9_9AGAR|nr:hypothetical protein D9757_011092 [Collybiopsis confluens]
MPSPSPSKKRRPTLTGSLRSDILLLSSLLQGKQGNGATAGRDHTNRKLSLLAYISNILLLGTHESPLAHAVHAVSGRIESETIECLVCSENTRTPKSSTSVPWTQPLEPGKLSPVDDVANDRRGGLLLAHWDDTAESEYYKESYSLEEHLRDVFQILSHIAVAPNQLNPVWAFLYLIHRRAFRKISSRIDEIFSRYRSLSPFEAMATAVRDGNFRPIFQPFQVTLDIEHAERKVMNQSRFPGFNDDWRRDDLPDGNYTVTVTSQNIGQWLDGFAVLLNYLRRFYPLPAKGDQSNNPRWVPPTSGKVVAAVYCLKCFLKLKPVLKFITEVEGMGTLLHDLETPPKDMSENQFLGQFKTPAKLKPKLQMLGETVNGDSDEDEDEDDDEAEAENAQCANTGDSRPSPEDLSDDEDEEEDDDDELDDQPRSPATRLMKSIYAVAAWMQSVDSLTSRAQTLVGMQFKVNIYRFSIQPVRANTKLKEKLARCFPEIDEFKNAHVGKILRRFHKATIHAEAALMGWVHSAPNALIKDGDIPIAVSKKCCFLCWLLHQLLNDLNDFNFILPGTHNQIFTWAPPPGTPRRVLHRLRDALLQVIQRYSTAHSAQSSAESAVLEQYKSTAPADVIEVEAVINREFN